MKIRGVLLAGAFSLMSAACAGAGDPNRSNGEVGSDGVQGDGVQSDGVQNDETGADGGRDRLAAVLDIKSGLEGPNRPHAVYQCGDGRRLTVVFDAERALVTTETGATPLVLPQQPAASGVRYATATHDLHSRGQEALWTVGRMMPIRCSALRP